MLGSRWWKPVVSYSRIKVHFMGIELSKKKGDYVKKNFTHLVALDFHV